MAYFTFADAVELPRDQDVVLIVKVKPSAINDTGIDNKWVRFAVLSGSVETKKTKIVSKSNGDEVKGKLLSFDHAYADAQYIRATVIRLADVDQSDSTLD
jgi:hypothetical protein